MCTHFDKLEISCSYFLNVKIALLFYPTLALIAIPPPKSSGLQTGRHGRANSSDTFSIKGKNEKLNYRFTNQVHNSPFLFVFHFRGLLATIHTKLICSTEPKDVIENK